MSRKRKNIKPDNNMNPENNGNPGGENNMRNMNDMGNIGQMLNNMDINQLFGQLSQMMGGPSGGSQGGFQSGPQGGGQGGPQNGFQGGPQGSFPGGFQQPRQAPRDPRAQLLQAFKPFVNKRRASMIDNIGQLYDIIKIVRRMNK